MALESTQPLIEMSTRNLSGGKGRPVRKADNLIAICEPIFLKNVGDSTSHNPMGHHGTILQVRTVTQKRRMPDVTQGATRETTNGAVSVVLLLLPLCLSY
jgi:hypothetical protein